MVKVAVSNPGGGRLFWLPVGYQTALSAARQLAGLGSFLQLAVVGHLFQVERSQPVGPVAG